MGDGLEQGITYDQGNKYERESSWHLNEAILHSRSQRSIHIKRHRTLNFTPEQRLCMREIITSGQRQYTDWGFKDPRTCLVYPLWATELPEHKLIIVYRDPAEAWPRYRPQHTRNRYREPYRAWSYLLSWCEHNANILTYLAQTPCDFLVLEYKALVTTQAEFDRLQRFVNRPLTDQRKPDLYRNRNQQHWLLSLVEPFLYRLKGYRPQTILQQLEAYRYEPDPTGITTFSI